MRKGILSSVAILVAVAPLAATEPQAPFLPPAHPPTQVAQGPPPAWPGDGHEPIGPGLAPLYGKEDTPPPSTWWARLDYLLWWVKDGPLPFPLVTTGDPNGINPGALNDPTTRVLFGGNGVNYGSSNGGRLTLGSWCWVEPRESVGFEFTGFMLERHSKNFAAASDASGLPLLAGPFFDPTGPGESALSIAFPGRNRGAVAISSALSLGGLELNGLVDFNYPNPVWLRLVGGFRYLEMQERIAGSAAQILLNFPSTIFGSEEVRTWNGFYGAQLGINAGYCTGSFTFEAQAKVAVGAMRETVQYAGQEAQYLPGQVTAFSGFVYTQPSNIGKRSTEQFAVVPEFQFLASMELLWGFRAFAGYTVLYASDVVRPGDQLDRVINPTQRLGGGLVGPARPGPLFNHTDFWAQGLNLGLQLAY